MGHTEKPIKTSIGIFFLSFGKDVFAGIENALYNLSLGLIENGADVHVYSGFLSGTENSIGAISIFRSHLLPSTLPKGDDTVRSTLAQNGPDIAAEILEFLKDRKITHLYICDPLWGIVQPTGVWRRINSPMVLSFHVLNTWDLLYQARGIPYSLHTAVSDYLRKQIQARVDLKNLQVIPNSIDIARFFRGTGRHKASVDAPIILCNGRIAPEKGTIYLVRSFPFILKTFPKAELWLCGGEYPFGYQRTALLEVKRAIQILDIGKNVRILPNLKWNEIPDFMHQSTLVVLPSLQETFGIAALEAMACGKPLVVTNVGNLPHLVEDSAVVVEPGSVAALADGILKVLQDEGLLNALTVRGPSIAEKYSNKTVACRLLDSIGAS
jgi:glycosyltransferase involved in cell wall biosynthesis